MSKYQNQKLTSNNPQNIESVVNYEFASVILNFFMCDVSVLGDEITHFPTV